MATGTTESPATLYGPLSLGFGVVALIAAFFLGFFGILAGSLAITFGILGLIGTVNRTQCAIGLTTGAIGVLYPLSFLLVFTGGF
ncbi:hypothetical protein ADL00_16240 [Streptomyces sp. AS58]|uniref:Uncharacterized protein n=1 Tax=Streptomyces cadmiisoli TaxID=2184053 RepID=A0A2Z4JDP1_9ACTN|nr:MULTISPECIES: hypothetical protein [Streptomyces]AWW43030.1 hypothetical protein DN051_41050 [Streptomyces cadmiisoli]KOV67342.1 hypothetical protein ADL00_16240 [Streptomyces sp. AS58]